MRWLQQQQTKTDGKTNKTNKNDNNTNTNTKNQLKIYCSPLLTDKFLKAAADCS